MSRDSNRNQTAALASMIGQAGCVTALVAVVIIALAFAGGWFLDDLMGNERKFMTVIFVFLSFPVTLYAMVRVSLAMVGRAQEQIEKINQDNKEESIP